MGWSQELDGCGRIHPDAFLGTICELGSDLDSILKLDGRDLHGWPIEEATLFAALATESKESLSALFRGMVETIVAGSNATV